MKRKAYFIGGGLLAALSFFTEARDVWMVGGLVLMWIGIARGEESA